MEQEAIEYLRTEREISAFRAESLRKLLSARGEASTKRLLAIEEEFGEIPFESISDDISSLLSAIKIFRSSRTAFYKMYDLRHLSSAQSGKILLTLRDSLKAEISLMAERLQDLGAKSARHVARVLVILISILDYVNKSISRIEALDVSIDYNDLLVEIGRKYELDIFSMFNAIIVSGGGDWLSTRAQGIIRSVRPLENLASSSSGDEFYLVNSEKIRGRNVFGFFIPSKHTGREILRPYHLSVFDHEGFDLSRLFDLDAKSVMFGLTGEYYKFVPVISLTKIKDDLVMLDRYDNFIRRIFDSKLGGGRGGIRIDTENSEILVPASRTEDEGLKEASIVASAIFQKLITATTNS